MPRHPAATPSPLSSAVVPVIIKAADPAITPKWSAFWRAGDPCTSLRAARPTTSTTGHPRGIGESARITASPAPAWRARATKRRCALRTRARGRTTVTAPGIRGALPSLARRRRRRRRRHRRRPHQPSCLVLPLGMCASVTPTRQLPTARRGRPTLSATRRVA